MANHILEVVKDKLCLYGYKEKITIFGFYLFNETWMISKIKSFNVK